MSLYSLLDLRTLLYIITLIGALTSIRISICSNGNSAYMSNKFDIWTMNTIPYYSKLDAIMDNEKIPTEYNYNNDNVIFAKWGYENYHIYPKDNVVTLRSESFDTDTKSSNDVVSHISTSLLLTSSLIIPMFIYNLLNSQLIII